MPNDKPIVGYAAQVKKPIVGSFSFSDKWAFSFEYFRQIEYFGLGETNSKWFVSLMDKLRDLSHVNPQEFERNKMLKTANRYHKINWQSKNIPYQRIDFNWISKDIMNNDEEFPFFQFQISKALGRIIGFWDLNRTFQVVLLDSKHNMQPSKVYDYKVDDTTELACEMTSLLVDLEGIKNINCSNQNCEVKASLRKLPSSLNRGNFVYALLDDVYYAELEQRLETRELKDIIELGLLT
jgi:hypothetical protein